MNKPITKEKISFSFSLQRANLLTLPTGKVYWARFLVRMPCGGKLHINPEHCRGSIKIDEWMNKGMKTKTLKWSQTMLILSPFDKKKTHVFDTFSNIDIITHKRNLPSDIVSKNLGKAIMKKNHFIRMTPFSVITSTIMSFKIFYKNPWVCIFCLRKV